jgi:hypothetical protein
MGAMNGKRVWLISIVLMLSVTVLAPTIIAQQQMKAITLPFRVLKTKLPVNKK